MKLDGVQGYTGVGVFGVGMDEGGVVECEVWGLRDEGVVGAHPCIAESVETVAVIWPYFMDGVRGEQKAYSCCGHDGKTGLGYGGSDPWESLLASVARRWLGAGERAEKKNDCARSTESLHCAVVVGAVVISGIRAMSMMVHTRRGNTKPERYRRIGPC